jgi:hypothetical protein
MLEYPPCPVCGGELPLREFFEEWDPSGRYQTANPALECPSCFARLRPKLLRAGLLMTAALIASFALMFMGMMFFRENDLASLVNGMAFVASFFWIQGSFRQRLITWREVAPGERVRFMLPTRAQRDQADAEARAAAEAERAAAAREAAAYPPWRCLTCGEENPGRFELCWKCESERLGSSASGLRRDRPTDSADKTDKP